MADVCKNTQKVTRVDNVFKLVLAKEEVETIINLLKDSGNTELFEKLYRQFYCIFCNKNSACSFNTDNSFEIQMYKDLCSFENTFKTKKIVQNHKEFDTLDELENFLASEDRPYYSVGRSVSAR